MAEVKLTYARVKEVRAPFFTRVGTKWLRKGWRAYLYGGNNELVWQTPTVYDDKRDAEAACRAAGVTAIRAG